MWVRVSIGGLPHQAALQRGVSVLSGVCSSTQWGRGEGAVRCADGAPGRVPILLRGGSVKRESLAFPFLLP